MKMTKRTFLVEIKYPECDKLVNAEDYLEKLNNLLEQDEDIEIDSVDEIVEKFENFINKDK